MKTSEQVWDQVSNQVRGQVRVQVRVQVWEQRNNILIIAIIKKTSFMVMSKLLIADLVICISFILNLMKVGNIAFVPDPMVNIHLCL